MDIGESMKTAFTQFDTSQQAVDRWLEHLPIASVGETARQLYLAMRDVNRQDTVPVKQHFHFLEGVTEPLALILPELYRHYAGKPLPLSEKRRKVADLYSQLLRQAILGYQQVIAHSIELSRFGWKKVVTTSVHRIFYLSSLLLCNYRQLYMPYQKGMWQQLYWIYQLVEKYDLIKARVGGLGSNRKKTSIETEFKKLLLHSLLSPNLFKPDELQSVIDNLDIWAQHVAITSSHRGESTLTYAFTLETDLPPSMIAPDISKAENQLIDVRYLDITDLIIFINKVLKHAKPGAEQVKLGHRRLISRRALLILINNWGRPSCRDGVRRLIQGTAEVAIGVSAIHYVISDGRQSAKEDALVEQAIEERNEERYSINLPPVEPKTIGQLGFTTERDTSQDVWESAYFTEDTPPPSWTESMRMKVYSYLNAKVLNISKGGFCIALPQDGVEHIQTNEVVAVRGKTGQWQLGEIRWMVCPTTGPIRAGIKKHSQVVRPAELILDGNIKSQSIKCLLGKNSEDKYVLFLPNLPTQFNGKAVTLKYLGENRQVNITEQIQSSPVGSAYLIEFIETKPIPSSLAKDSDDYESIWASL
jgi:hypothetical protein